MYDRCGEVVIKDGLRIAGERVKIVSQNKIQIDCEFEGDVSGPEVVVGERGKVTGNIAGDRVIVLGKIVGDIRGKMVTLLSTAHVEGDIHHASLAIDEGAEFAGRCRHTNVSGWVDERKNAA
jgi:cytoskeletal protein CcmA (bactofilin family)